jgi:hypothetical protein
MVQQDERTQEALAYIRHQASTSLADVCVVVERFAAACGRCVDGISEGQARFRPGNEWSVKEVLGLVQPTLWLRRVGGSAGTRPIASPGVASDREKV